MLTPDGQIDFPALHANFEQRLAGVPGAAPAKSEKVAVTILKGMIQLGHHYLEVEPDEQDKLMVAKSLVMLRQLVAKDQQDAQQAGGQK